MLERVGKLDEPRAEERRFETVHHGITLADEFAWLRAKNWQEVMRDPSVLDPTIRALALSGELGMDAAFAQGVMAPLSEGAVDIPSVIHFLKTKGYEGYCIVEQDPAEGAAMTPEILARNNLAYLSALLAA